MRKSITMVDNLSRYLNGSERRVLEVLKLIEGLEKTNKGMIYSKDLSNLISEHFSVAGHQGQLQGMAYFYRDWVSRNLLRKADGPGNKKLFGLGEVGRELLYKSLAN